MYCYSYNTFQIWYSVILRKYLNLNLEPVILVQVLTLNPVPYLVARPYILLSYSCIFITNHNSNLKFMLLVVLNIFCWAHKLLVSSDYNVIMVAKTNPLHSLETYYNDCISLPRNNSVDYNNDTNVYALSYFVRCFKRFAKYSCFF